MLISFGENTFAQLGNSKAFIQEFKPVPVEVPENVNFVDVRCASHCTVALSNENQVYAWGLLYQNLLSSPVRIQIKHRVSQIRCGMKHCVVLTSSGEVLTWGQGSFGALGHGEFSTFNSKPRIVSSLKETRITGIAAGGYNSAAWTSSSKLYMWGFNRYSQCATGLKYKAFVNRPRQVTHKLNIGGIEKVVLSIQHCAILSKKGQLYTWGKVRHGRLGYNTKGMAETSVLEFPMHVKFFESTRLLDCASGNAHMLALTQAHEVFAWGCSDSGQTGQNSLFHWRFPKRVAALDRLCAVRIACGAFHSVVVTSLPNRPDSTKIFVWGRGGGGQLGLGHDWTPERHRGLQWGDKFDGRRDALSPQLVLRNVGNVSSIACGSAHTVVLCEDMSSSSYPSELMSKPAVPTTSAPPLPSHDLSVREVFSLARHDRIEDLRRALVQGFSITSRDENHNTLLHVAAQNGRKRVARLCLQLGFTDLNAQNMRGQTALHFCFAYVSFERVAREF